MMARPAPAAPLRVLFVGGADGSGGATAAAVGADRAIDLVARATGAVAGLGMLAEHEPDVVVLYGDAASGPDRAALDRAAASLGAAVIAVNGTESFSMLRERVRSAAGGRKPRPARPAGRLAGGGAARATRLIAIGASTGGVEALVQVLGRFPPDTPPTIVVQHMPQLFTASFAARLDALCAPRVAEAWDGAPLDPGVIYVAPGGPAHLEVQWTPARRVRLSPTDPVNRHRPSVDVAFDSIVRAGVQGVVAVLLTGMGRDGAEGLLRLRHAGARTIAQDRDTSTVYGMPKAALENGAVDRGTPLAEIAEAIFTPEALQKEAT